MRIDRIASLCFLALAAIVGCSTADGTNPAEDSPSRLDPYPVGNRTMVFVDESRNDPATGGPRTLVTEVWYPAADEAADMGRDRLTDFLSPWEDFVLDLLAEEGVPEDEIDHFSMETGSVRDAPIHREGGPFPFIVFSHSNAGVRFQNFTMCEYLAGQGFVVIAPDHTGNALVAPLPAGPVVFDERLIFISFWQRKADLSFLITKFSDLAKNDPEGFFTGRLDPSRVGAAGHSFGATAAVETTRQDHRIGAVLVMASFMFPWKPEAFDASLMFFIALEDNTMNESIYLFKYDYLIASPPKFKLECADCGHYSYTDSCLLIPSLLGDGDGCGKGVRRRGGEAFDFVEHDVVWGVINPYIAAFFSFNLRGDGRMGEYLTGHEAPAPFRWTFEMEGM